VDLNKEQRLRKKLHNELEDLKGKIRVICRIRPMSQSEKKKGSENVMTIEQAEEKITVVDKSKDHTFDFDAVFGPTASQSEVFAGPKRLIQTAVDGFNVCIFACK